MDKATKQLERRHEKEAAIPYLSPVEEESLRLLETTKKTEEELDAYYPQMLEGKVSEEQIQGRVDSLHRASGNLFKAWTQIGAAHDALTTLKTRRKSTASSRPLPPTRPST